MTVVSYDDLTDEQRRAVEAHDRNVTLTAGAGTGKTLTLTIRYLRLLIESLAERDDESDGDGDHLLPTNILTTTFTERAASDLERKIRTAITGDIASVDPQEFAAWRTVADELDTGYIHTLHGFCARLLREHAVTIDAVEPGFDTLDDDETTALIDDTVGAVLEDYDTHAATQTLARRFSRRQLQNVVTDLLGERPESLDWADRWADASEAEYLAFVESELHPIDPEVAADRLARPEFVEAADTLAELIENPPGIETGGRAWRRAEGVVERLDANFDDGVPSRAKQTLLADLSQQLTTGSGDRYAGYTGAATRWNDHPRKAEFDRAFESLVDTLRPEDHAVDVDMALEANSFPFVRALAELTQLAAAEYEDRKARQNVVDFTDQITYAVEFLEREANAELREQLREQFAYVMVDEFQDTDPRQWELIKLLTDSDGATFDAENVCIVGDVKQSIYRFRNADVTQFEEITRTLERVARGAPADAETGSDDQLSTSFRTLPPVLECINELFEAVFDADGEPYEAAPQSLTADRDDPSSLGSVEYLAVPTDPALRSQRFDHYEAFATAEPEHDADLEAMALAARLSQLLTEPYRIYPEDDEDDATTIDLQSLYDPEVPMQTRQDTDEGDDSPEPRPVEPSDIAVLLRSRTHLKRYERALDATDIPYSVASGIGFYEMPEIRALVNLFRALADPQDERALYAVLRSPLFGLTDDTLARLKLTDDSLWNALAASDYESLSEAYASLVTWRQRAGLGNDAAGNGERSWAGFLTRIIEETGYLVSVSADERPRQAMANVGKFREHLRKLSDDGVRSLPTLVNRLERRIELGGRESEAETTAEGVQILTIHDAKGMEFPVVVVPGLGRRFKDEAALGGGQVEFEQVGDHHAVGMKAPSSADPFDMVGTTARKSIRKRRRAEERAEEKRVLYVACTRARDHLLLTGCHDSAGEADEPTLTDLAEPDPESASSWRDWVQPELLTDGICAALDTDNRVRRSYGAGEYTVSLPTPPVEQGHVEAAIDPDVELSPDPTGPELGFRLSATELASFRNGYGELQLDGDTQTVSVEGTTAGDGDASPDSRRGEDVSEVRGSDSGQQPRTDAATDGDDVAATVFGEMVHRLCELRPPKSSWKRLMEQTLVEESATGELTPALQRRVERHAQRGIDYVDAQTAAVEVEHRYDELFVTAEFERGEIAGYVDHLLVTPEAYHIIDYKTGEVTPEGLEDEATYYLDQMKAYAVALHQQGTGRSVRVSLVFTQLDDAWEVEWEAATVDEIEDEIRNTLADALAGFP